MSGYVANTTTRCSNGSFPSVPPPCGQESTANTAMLKFKLGNVKRSWADANRFTLDKSICMRTTRLAGVPLDACSVTGVEGTSGGVIFNYQLVLPPDVTGESMVAQFNALSVDGLLAFPEVLEDVEAGGADALDDPTKLPSTQTQGAQAGNNFPPPPNPPSDSGSARCASIAAGIAGVAALAAMTSQL